MLHAREGLAPRLNSRCERGGSSLLRKDHPSVPQNRLRASLSCFNGLGRTASERDTSAARSAGFAGGSSKSTDHFLNRSGWSLSTLAALAPRPSGAGSHSKFAICVRLPFTIRIRIRGGGVDDTKENGLQ